MQDKQDSQQNCDYQRSTSTSAPLCKTMLNIEVKRKIRRRTITLLMHLVRKKIERLGNSLIGRNVARGRGIESLVFT